jgi:hypothetical protein
MLPLSRALGYTLTLTLVACSRGPSPAECTAMLDRYTEKLVGSDRPDVKAGELEKLKADARARAAEDPEFAECTHKVSRSAYECAMHAETVDRMEICLN